MKQLNSIEIAIEAGKTSFVKGLSCIVPPQYSGCEFHFAAWKLGWTQAASNTK